MRIDYTNGATVTRNGTLSVNGGATTPVAFPSTGSFTTVGSVTVTVNLKFFGDELQFSTEANVGLGATKEPALVGKAE